MMLGDGGRARPMTASERSRRYRENRKRNPAPPGHRVIDVTPAGERSPFPAHSTTRLESIGSGPERYASVPPHVDAPIDPPAEPSIDQQAGAQKVALIVAGMFQMALGDASVRYELGQRLAAAGVEADELGKWNAAAVAHVHGATVRACLKHGIGLALPYEDELTAVGAAVGSAIYLAAKFTGRLDAAAGELAAPPTRTVEVRAEESIDLSGPIVIERTR